MMRRVGMFTLIAVVVVLVAWYGLFWRPESSHLAGAGPRNSRRHSK